MSNELDLLIVTGLSGAGKTHAMKALEDIGFFCIDNLPPRFLPQLAGLQRDLARDDGRRVAVAMDVRGRAMFDDLFASLDALDARGTEHTILFLDCSDEILVRRYSETRRRHPLAQASSLLETIADERRQLSDVRARADVVIDTTRMRTADLASSVARVVTGVSLEDAMSIDVVSFGFKHGVPLDADLMLDVRFLPNPFYVEGLRMRTGLEDDVRDYVLDDPDAQAWLADVIHLLERWMPAYQKTMRARLTIGVGCTGGQHRSVALAEAIAAGLGKDLANVHVRHRDLPLAATGPQGPAPASAA